MHPFRSLIQRLSVCIFVTVAIHQWRVSAADVTNKTEQATNLLNATPEEREKVLRFINNRDLIKVRYFQPIQVNLEGDAVKIGLDSKELSDFLTLKFKNLFSSYEIKELSTNSWKVKDAKSLDEFGDIEFQGIDRSEWALMTVKIWVVGEDYPLAYHIHLDIGRLGGGSHGYEDERLGVSSAKNLKENRRLKDSLADMLEKAAIELMKLRESLK